MTTDSPFDAGELALLSNAWTFTGEGWSSLVTAEWLAARPTDVALRHRQPLRRGRSG